jgi:hypothetical protein
MKSGGFDFTIEVGDALRVLCRDHQHRLAGLSRSFHEECPDQRQRVAAGME